MKAATERGGAHQRGGEGVGAEEGVAAAAFDHRPEERRAGEAAEAVPAA